MSKFLDKQFEDLSSADEEALRRKRKLEDEAENGTKRSKAASSSKSILNRKKIELPELKPLNDKAIESEETVNTDLEMHTIDDLFELFPHIKSGTCKLSQAKIAGVRPTSNTVIRRSAKADNQIKELQALVQPPSIPHDTSTNPMYHEMFVDLFKKHIYTPIYMRINGLEAGLTQAQLDQKLHHRHIHLELMTASLESELLKESGRWSYEVNGQHRLVDFPSCANEAECIVYNQNSELNRVMRRSGARPFKPCSIMTRHEYDTLLLQNIQPRVRRCCVICHRYGVTLYTLETRASRFSNSDFIKQYDNTGDVLITTTKETPPVYQLTRNLVDEEEGYKKQYMLMPLQGDCIIEPIARPMADKIFVNLVPGGGGRLMIDQEQLKFRRETSMEPTMSESLSHF